MSNPVTPFRNNLFASRGCDIQSALDYVDQLATASTDPVAVQTAARVLLNTIDSAVTQSQGPTPLEEALFAIIDKRIAVLQINTQVEINASIDDWMDNRPRTTDEDERRDLLALLPAIVEVGDLRTLLEVRGRLRTLAGAAEAFRCSHASAESVSA